MPRSKLDNVNAAVKHLFRHFDDSQQLRRNPLARRYFTGVGADAIESDTELAIANLRYDVFAAAEACRNADIEHGNRSRALRRFDILRLQYFEGRSPAEVAGLFNISVKHCYRERAAAQRQVGQILFRHINISSTVVPGDDDYFALLSRLSEHQATVANQGLRAFDYLQRVAESPFQRIAALQALGLAQLSLGTMRELEGTYDRSRRLLELHASSLGHDAADILLVSGRLLKAAMMEHKEHTQNYSLQDSKALASIADRLPVTGNQYAFKLWLLAQKYLVSALWIAGKLGEAYDVANRAERRLDACNFHCSLRLDVQADLWRIRTYLVATKTSHYRLERRLRGLESIYKQSRDSGSSIHAVEALIAMTECSAFGRNHDEALEAARKAVKESRDTGSDVFVSQTIIDVAARLLATDHWRVAVELLTRCDITFDVGTYRRNLLRYAFALAALRTGDFKKAKEWSNAEESLPATIRLRQQIVKAQALYYLGDLADAQVVATESLENAEMLGSSPVLGAAFETAGTILKSPKFLSSANEIARILAA